MANEKVAYGEIIQIAVQEAPDRVIRRGDDWLFMHIETSIDNSRNTGQLFIFFDDLIVASIDFFGYQLRPSRSIDVHRSGHGFFHKIGAIKRYGHESSRMHAFSINGCKTLVCIFHQDDRCKWHEFSSLEFFIERIVDVRIDSLNKN